MYRRSVAGGDRLCARYPLAGPSFSVKKLNGQCGGRETKGRYNCRQLNG